jgi:hypothetical protein
MHYSLLKFSTHIHSHVRTSNIPNARVMLPQQLHLPMHICSHVHTSSTPNLRFELHLCKLDVSEIHFQVRTYNYLMVAIV